MLIPHLRMYVYGKCKSCKHSLRFKTEAPTRIELAMRNGEYIGCTCPSCSLVQQQHVNSFRATYSKIPQLLAGIIFGIGTLGGLYFGFFVLENVRNHYLAYGACSLLLIPGLVYTILHEDERRRVNAFNQMQV